MSSEGPIAAVAVVRDDRAVLLQLRDADPAITHPDMWVFPGGHGRADEDPAACARRELEEETGYRASELVHLGVLVDPEEIAHGPIDLFAARYDGRQAIECREGADMRWFSRADAARVDVPGFLLAAWDELLIPYLSAAADPLEAQS